ncbi:MAG TPA: c-type cytochrome [Steroidobacteraceae bacterium]|nr:c-type cytochrome [Steroidobacteraceae bacterium]
MIESRFSIGLAGFAAAVALCFAQVAAAAEPAPVTGSAEAGAAKAAVCSACHGPNGNSTNPEWPSLAGQNATYIREQLAMFKAKKRNNPVMFPIVEPMSEQDFADVAAYFSTQTPAGLEADPSYWKAGEALYKSGDVARGIPACASCHGPSGMGNPAAGYPALRAQHSVYTVKQLQDYLTQNRYRDPADSAKVYTTRNSPMMTTVASRLTPEDIRNLASYLQGLR